MSFRLSFLLHLSLGFLVQNYKTLVAADRSFTPALGWGRRQPARTRQHSDAERVLALLPRNYLSASRRHAAPLVI